MTGYANTLRYAGASDNVAVLAAQPPVVLRSGSPSGGVVTVCPLGGPSCGVPGGAIAYGCNTSCASLSWSNVTAGVLKTATATARYTHVNGSVVTTAVDVTLPLTSTATVCFGTAWRAGSAVNTTLTLTDLFGQRLVLPAAPFVVDDTPPVVAGAPGAVVVWNGGGATAATVWTNRTGCQFSVLPFTDPQSPVTAVRCALVCLACGPSDADTTTLNTSVSYVDVVAHGMTARLPTLLTCGARYQWRVRAVNAAGCVSSEYSSAAFEANVGPPVHGVVDVTVPASLTSGRLPTPVRVIPGFNLTYLYLHDLAHACSASPNTTLTYAWAVCVGDCAGGPTASTVWHDVVVGGSGVVVLPSGSLLVSVAGGEVGLPASDSVVFLVKAMLAGAGETIAASVKVDVVVTAPDIYSTSAEDAAVAVAGGVSPALTHIAYTHVLSPVCVGFEVSATAYSVGFCLSTVPNNRTALPDLDGSACDVVNVTLGSSDVAPDAGHACFALPHADGPTLVSGAWYT